MSIQKAKTATEKIANKRDDLEALTETDLPAGELAKALLEVAEGEK
ncbi:hypothetical protein [Halobellus captivus]|nr:hypothetical protein [Halobellus captivus]